jgi:hypothetical protein
MDLLTLLLLLLPVALVAGVLIGRTWAYQRACATADQPDVAVPDVVASLAPIWRPKVR